jgi:hypothetical protein
MVIEKKLEQLYQDLEILTKRSKDIDNEVYLLYNHAREVVAKYFEKHPVNYRDISA